MKLGDAAALGGQGSLRGVGVVHADNQAGVLAQYRAFLHVTVIALADN
jgi:hypothetical protein